MRAPAGQRRHHGQPVSVRGRAARFLACALMVAGTLAGGFAAEPVFSPAGYQFETWDVDAGLPQSSVTAVVQSRDGYLWLGTQNGLARFDGVRFKVFSPEVTPGFPGNRITSVFEDSRRELWFGVEGGGAGRLRHGKIAASTKLPDGIGTVTCIAEDASGAMWFGTQTGEVIRYAGGLTRVFDRRDGLPGEPVRGLVADAEGLIWAVTAQWFGTLQKERFERHAWSAPGNHALAARRSGGVWLANGNGLAILSRDGGQLSQQFPDELSAAAVQMAIEDRKGVVWIGLNGGGLLRATEGRFETLGVEQGLASNTVLALHEDTEGNVWVGTHNGGLTRLKQRLFAVLDARVGLMEENVISVCERADGGVWLGTERGLHLMGRDGGITRFGAEQGLRREHITAVCEDRKGNLLVGTWGGGLFRRVGERFEPFAGEVGKEGQFIRAIYEDSPGRLWVGTQLEGAYCYDESGQRHYDTGAGLAHSDVRAIWCDRSGAVWFGTGGGGLSCLRSGKLTTLTTAEGLPSDFVRTLFEDESGALWVGTSGGLARCKDGKVAALQTKHGLTDNFISQIFKDRRRTFWFGSNRGIFRVSARELELAADGLTNKVRCFNYTKADGLAGRECNGGNQPAGWLARDGRLWFPTPQGVAIVDPANLQLNVRPPRVIIEAAVADGRALLREDGAVDGMDPDAQGGGAPVPSARLRVPAGCKRLEIAYTGINLAAPKRMQFRYRLADYDSDWTEAGAERVAIYHRPSPGDYLFHVSAVNSDGVWNETGATLAITVLAPFWRTGWFLGLSAVASVGLLAYGIRFVSVRKVQRALDAMTQQQALAAERARIAADMHDQLGSRLTQIGLMGEMARRQAASPEAVTRQLDKITAQSREVAKSLDEIVWAVNPGNDTLDRTAAYIVHFTEEFFEATTTRCWLDVPPDLPAHPLSAERRHHLFLAFKEALTNVARHAAATDVWVQLSADANWMRLTVRDNGRGFATAGATGNGLGNMKSRIEAMGGRLELSSQLGAGTRLTFHVPVAAPPSAVAGARGFGTLR